MLNKDVVKLINYFIFANLILAEGKDLSQKLNYYPFSQSLILQQKNNTQNRC